MFGSAFDAQLEGLRTIDDYVALYGERAPGFEPGSRWAYSNYGMVLAGAIVERVGAISYYEYVQKNICAPAGMTDSDCCWKQEKIPNLAKGYTNSSGALRSNYESLPMRGLPAGGGYSTSEDLLHFATALTSHRLLDAKHTKLVTTRRPGTPRGPYGYGYGFQTWNDGGARGFGHAGGHHGINSSLRIYPDSGYVIAVMANQDPPAASRLSYSLALRLPAS